MDVVWTECEASGKVTAGRLLSPWLRTSVYGFVGTVVWNDAARTNLTAPIRCSSGWTHVGLWIEQHFEALRILNKCRTEIELQIWCVRSARSLHKSKCAASWCEIRLLPIRTINNESERFSYDRSSIVRSSRPGAWDAFDRECQGQEVLPKQPRKWSCPDFLDQRR